MVETVILSKLCLEDIDLGYGTRSVRLFDGSLHTLNQVPGRLDIISTVTLPSVSGATVSATFPNPAGARLHGVTTKITTGIGTSNGTTSFDIGDAVLVDRWGRQSTLTANAETDASDFTDNDEPIVSASYAAILTANGGNFDGTGDVEVQLHWSLVKHR